MLPRILSRNRCHAKNRPMIRLWSRVRRSRTILPRVGAGVGAAESELLLGARVGLGNGAGYASQEPESERPRLCSPDCNLILISSSGSAGAGRFFPESEPELEPLRYFTRS